MNQALFDSNWGTIAVGLTVGCLMLVAALVALSRPRSAWLRSRLEPYGGGATASGDGAGRSASLRPDLERLLARSERAFGKTTASQRLSVQLERAGSTVTPGRLAAISLGIGVAAFAIVGLFTGIVLAIVAGAVGLVLPVARVTRAGQKRMQLLEDQLPDVLMTMAGSLRVGQTFDHSMAAIVSDGLAPSSEEFARVLRETRLGRPIEESLEALAIRSGSSDLKYVLMAVSMQREMGGSLADLFQTVSDTVRQRQQFRRRVKALTATGRMSAMLLIALPFVCAALITVVSPGYLAPLFTTSVGQVLCIALIVMMTLGAYLLRRVVTIKG